MSSGMFSFWKMLLIWPDMILDTLDNSTLEPPAVVMPDSSLGRKLLAMSR